MIVEYVVGFLFSPDQRKVALIQRLKPEWQRGRYNGIGGQIETRDITRAASKDGTGLTAMRRYGLEETAVDIPNWQHYADLISKYYTTHCFCAFDYKIDDLKSPTDEQMHVFRINALPDQLVHNAKWLIDMALNIVMVEGNFYRIYEGH